MATIPVSVQLYSVRDDMNQDMAGTIRKVAAIGYVNVETAGLAGVGAREFKRLLDDCGLKAPSAHVGYDSLIGDALARTIDDYAAIECRKLIIPSLPQSLRKGGEGYTAVASLLNEIGGGLAARGFELGYHNHGTEFDEKSGGKNGLEQLIEGTTPGLVSFELDTFWAKYAGEDPVAVFEAHADRFTMLHIKDMAANGRSFAALGTGILPLDALLAAAERAKSVAYLVVEQDSATEQTPLEAIEIAYKTLAQKGYA